MRVTTIVLLAAALLLTTAASAAPVKPWVGVSGSWATYSMSDANSFIRELNDTLAAYGPGPRMDEINNGFGFGASLGLDLPMGVTIGVAYERLSASTDVGDAFSSFKFQHPANAFRAFGEYALPMQGPVGLHLGLSGGLVSESGQMKLEVMGQGSESIDLSGSGPLVEGYLGSTFWAARRFGFDLAAGYRYAKVSEVKAQFAGITETMTNTDGSKFTTDYSGVFLRLGLRLAFVE